LGDLLLQVVFHAQMASEKKLFGFSEVVDTLAEKLLRRHPHVFGNVEIDNDDELHRMWEAEKSRERQRKKSIEKESVLDGITQALPALMRAEKIQRKAARVGFDWQELAPVIDKIHEEIGEVEEAVAGQSAEQQQEEIGDLLFAVVNLARHLEVDSETALRRANEKFIARFKKVEQTLAERQQSFSVTSLEELEVIWQQVKQTS
ncbi:MAG: nucleoside triphosphate pyrophosphohydrolase, partial [Gammaproteobacteria bacterium]|nr:nucleoside triphosphate pyrophosphohydrolase [Gammaproteobacteria bacterium]